MTTASVQDRHLDALLSIALEQMEQEENERFAATQDPQMETACALRLDQALASAYETANQAKRRSQHKMWERKAVRGLRLAAVGLAAVIVLALAVFPVALAASAEFRGRAMKLFVQIDERRGVGSFTFSPEDHPEAPPMDDAPDVIDYDPDIPSAPPISADGSVPDWWRGAYYPSVLPEDMRIDSFSVESSVTYRGAGGAYIVYSEKSGGQETAGTFGYMSESEMRQVSINGETGALIRSGAAESPHMMLYWQASDAMFLLETYKIEEADVIRVAENVTPCGRNRLPPVSLARDEQGCALPPREWGGRFFPADVPEGFCLNGMNGARIQLLHPQTEQTLTLQESFFNSPSIPSLETVAAARLIDLGGSPGLLVVQNNAQYMSLYWEIFPGGWFFMESQGIPEEELVEIAGSVREITLPAPVE